MNFSAAGEKCLPWRWMMPSGRRKTSSESCTATSVRALHLGPDGRLGQDGDAGADLDHALDGLDVVELHHVADLHAVAAQQAVGLLARRDVALVADQRLALQACGSTPAGGARAGGSAGRRAPGDPGGTGRR